jgi:dCTP deaminase
VIRSHAFGRAAVAAAAKNFPSTSDSPVSIKSDAWILRMCEERNLITPFERTLIRQVNDRRIISCGLSSYGYDCRLAKDEFKVFSPIQGTEINPKNFDPNNLLDIPLREDGAGGAYWLLPPHSYALGVTIESFVMPRNVTAIALGKSTYARVGLIQNTTPLEPEWEGRLVVEIYNAANLPVRLYAEEGFVQILFFESDETCVTSYRDRAGKYQNQTGLTLAKL